MLSMIIGGIKLIYDCMKECMVNNNFILGFINYKNIKGEVNPV